MSPLEIENENVDEEKRENKCLRSVYLFPLNISVSIASVKLWRYLYCVPIVTRRSASRFGAAFNVILIKLSQRSPLRVVNKNVRPAVAHVVHRLLRAPAVLHHQVTAD